MLLPRQTIGVDESFWWHVARCQCQCQCQAKSGSTEVKCAGTRVQVAVLPVADQKGCGERNIQPLHSFQLLVLGIMVHLVFIYL